MTIVCYVNNLELDYYGIEIALCLLFWYNTIFQRYLDSSVVKINLLRCKAHRHNICMRTNILWHFDGWIRSTLSFIYFNHLTPSPQMYSNTVNTVDLTRWVSETETTKKFMLMPMFETTTSSLLNPDYCAI